MSGCEHYNFMSIARKVFWARCAGAVLASSLFFMLEDHIVANGQGWREWKSFVLFLVAGLSIRLLPS